ncbi:MAG: methionine gamma-lyase family protein [Candidatus Eremiobacteraeota bacterium]|nr:methionine gamma-lyase family protein [Candidatus Eremiobacteraeota bacterium]
MIADLCARLGIGDAVKSAAERAFSDVSAFSYPAQQTNRLRVIEAFMAEGVAESDLAGSTGYGYDDAARERYESLLCRVFGTEGALARLSIVSGTHAIVAAIAACVPPGKAILSVTGRPYDTLRNAILEAPHSLRERGLDYREVELLEGSFDFERIERELRDEKIGAVFVQRSRGYATRPSVNVAVCARLCERVKSVRPDVLVLVDNCYGELVETQEPAHVGADLIMGSLIKNIGGSIAPAGAYIAGRADVLKKVSAYLYAPGLRSALGPTLGFGRELLQGLFLAPLVVEQALRGMDFAAALFANLGFAVDPQPGSARTDIVQAIRLGKPQLLLAFARGLQRSMPVNARFTPEPGAVPGYRDPVVMSSGAFVGGATIELSCDAPLREPYEVYLQGGVTAEHAVVGSLLAAHAVHQIREGAGEDAQNAVPR